MDTSLLNKIKRKIKSENYLTGSIGVISVVVETSVVVVVFKILVSKVSKFVLPADRRRDTKIAAECSSRNKNCGSRFLAGTILNKHPEKI